MIIQARGEGLASGQNDLVGVTEVQSCDSFEVFSKTAGVKKNCAVPNPINFNTGSRCRARSSCALLFLLMEQTLSPSLPFPIPMV